MVPSFIPLTPRILTGTDIAPRVFSSFQALWLDLCEAQSSLAQAHSATKPPPYIPGICDTPLLPHRLYGWLYARPNPALPRLTRPPRPRLYSQLL